MSHSATEHNVDMTNSNLMCLDKLRFSQYDMNQYNETI